MNVTSPPDVASAPMYPFRYNRSRHSTSNVTCPFSSSGMLAMNEILRNSKTYARRFEVVDLASSNSSDPKIIPAPTPSPAVLAWKNVEAGRNLEIKCVVISSAAVLRVRDQRHKNMKRTVITLVVGFGVILAGAVQTTLHGRAHAKVLKASSAQLR